MFNEMKTAQAAAYFLYKANGLMPHLKLMKLLYLADRLSWLEQDVGISGDDYYSLPYGPVLSKTLDLIQGNRLTAAKTVWEEWISDKADHHVSLAKVIDNADADFFDHLSLCDKAILDRTFQQYGHFDKFALAALTHDPAYVPEWEMPSGNMRSKPIKLETLLSHLGKSPAQIQQILQDIAEREAIDQLFRGCAD